ncbi:MAG: RIO1 family regulatory kinase/ATPase, partial [Candidatus Woesearchaeota archaeon]
MTRDKHKIYNNVFDDYTKRIITQLFSSHIIDEILSPVSIGKEANVFTALKGDDLRILKIYRLQACNFNQMYQYLVSDPMYIGIKKNRRQIILNWVQREFSNMNKAHDNYV